MNVHLTAHTARRRRIFQVTTINKVKGESTWLLRQHGIVCVLRSRCQGLPQYRDYHSLHNSRPLCTYRTTYPKLLPPRGLPYEAFSTLAPDGQFEPWDLRPITHSPEVVSIAHPTRNLEYGQYATFRASTLKTFWKWADTIQRLFAKGVELEGVQFGGHCWPWASCGVGCRSLICFSVITITIRSCGNASHIEMIHSMEPCVLDT